MADRDLEAEPTATVGAGASAASDAATEREPAPTGRRRARWSPVAKAVSAGVALVGAVTGVVSVWQVATRDTSSFSTLTIVASPVTEGVAEYALPLSRLEGDLPVFGEPCDAEQREWLASNGEQLNRRFRVEMRNSASEGAMLALADFRSDVEPSAATVPVHVLVVCPSSGAATAVRAAGLMVDVPDATAHYQALTNTEQARPTPEIPVTWNLAPGESGLLDLEISAETTTSGALVVTALGGRDSSTVEIEGSSFEMPGLWRHGRSYFTVGANGFECVREFAGGSVVPCDETDLAELAEYRDAAFSKS